MLIYIDIVKHSPKVYKWIKKGRTNRIKIHILHTLDNNLVHQVIDMKTVLFLPLLQIPSGHHQAADALKDGLLAMDPQLQCHKIELLSSRLGRGEKLVSYIYVNWIRHFPKTYNTLYYHSVVRQKKRQPSFPHYELLFLEHVKNIVKHVQPDIILCTHSLPSYLLNRLKRNGEITNPVVNVYTDYFVHDLWGTEAIDCHFIGHPYMKMQLRKKGVPENRICVTGIPLHPDITIEKREKQMKRSRYFGLISGGSLGIGTLKHMLKKISPDDPIDYYVLCGKNERMYKQLQSENHPRLIPLPYISSRQEMNALYDQADFILTKPGGVTISECLYKRLPIFIYDTLPGQEEINFRILKRHHLVFDFLNWKELRNISDAILSILHSPQITHYFAHVEQYHRQLSAEHPAALLYATFASLNKPLLQ
ncbi:putative glycosyltransferase YkoN [Parageobacillus caldoxylosilyticus]|nr:putative glycosyltransferase YkoN [Parageobacillus caldoxylosilyticus]BDG39848.1 putative glycosyltransferase YkoN [Parageobacillus caldoxylosilyticus]